MDIHLAEIYGVETRALKQAVRRNHDLFPDDFMFSLKSISRRFNPDCIYRSRGSNVIRSFEIKRAKQMNIYIMRAFEALRKIVLNNSELRLEIENIKVKVGHHEKNIELVFQYLDDY